MISLSEQLGNVDDAVPFGAHPYGEFVHLIAQLQFCHFAHDISALPMFH
jgi:hypothetical protein